jgi:hypothetical protein
MNNMAWEMELVLFEMAYLILMQSCRIDEWQVSLWSRGVCNIDMNSAFVDGLECMFLHFTGNEHLCRVIIVKMKDSGAGDLCYMSRLLSTVAGSKRP